MSTLRRGRQKFYNVFSYCYDFFITLHSGHYRNETRNFLVDSAQPERTKQVRVLDVCCGTGSVALAFADKYVDALTVGCDFSTGMLHKAALKDTAHKILLVHGDAACLPFGEDCFDIVCCSHALYELKGQARTAALQEMKRVVTPRGQVLVMEHEVPQNYLVKIMFYIRMLMMGPTDAREFLEQGLTPFRNIFNDVTLSHSPSGKSKLVICRKS